MRSHTEQQAKGYTGPSQLALLALIGELARMLEKLKKTDFACAHEVHHMLCSTFDPDKSNKKN